MKIPLFFFAILAEIQYYSRGSVVVVYALMGTLCFRTDNDRSSPFLPKCSPPTWRCGWIVSGTVLLG